MLKHLKQVFQIMQDSGLYLKISNMELHQDNALVLRHIINKICLCADPKKVQDIKNAKPQMNTKH